MHNDIQRAGELYASFVTTAGYKPKMRMHKALGEAGGLLLALDLDDLDSDGKNQWRYLAWKVAVDLQALTVDMAHTRAYDCDPILGTHWDLALQLASRCASGRADPALIPFLAVYLDGSPSDEISHERWALYRECAELNSARAEVIANAERPCYSPAVGMLR